MAARHDLTADPTVQAELVSPRLGTALFARTLAELDDAELDGASLLPDWSRRHVVSHLAYNARAIARLAEWARTGVETPMYESVAVRNQEIADGAKLTPTALRAFFEESAAQLDEAWSTLPTDAWAHPVRAAQGREVLALDTVWMRARELWVHAVDLAGRATFADVPAAVVERLLGDIVRAWTSRGEQAGLILNVTDSAVLLQLGDTEAAEAEIVSGTRAALAEWATGRGTAGVSSTMGNVRPAPRWL